MARVSDHAPTADDLEALRGPLTGYCYRMLGSAADTDDAVQEAIIRAHRHRDRFDGSRASLSTWMHAIATNVCLDMLRSAKRRALLASVPASHPGDTLDAPLPADEWLEPMPDSRTVHAPDPADLTLQRESVRLAFLAALQYLTPRQRAVLLLRDVYSFTAAETAEVLDLTAAAVNSALQRARGTLAERRPSPADVTEDAQQEQVLHRYIAAFEAHDVDALRKLLHADTVSSMPPLPWWLSGRDDVLATFAGSDACLFDRLLPVRVNGTVGFGQYRPADDGALRPFAVVVLEIRDGAVAHTVTFLGSGTRFAEFGLPEKLPPRR
jgi:RNA polymerase sigma-70 factor (ECF subfamily)